MEKIYREVTDDNGNIVNVWYNPVTRYYETPDGNSFMIYNGQWVEIDFD